MKNVHTIVQVILFLIIAANVVWWSWHGYRYFSGQRKRERIKTRAKAIADRDRFDLFTHAQAESMTRKQEPIEPGQHWRGAVNSRWRLAMCRVCHCTPQPYTEDVNVLYSQGWLFAEGGGMTCSQRCLDVYEAQLREMIEEARLEHEPESVARFGARPNWGAAA